MTAIPFSERPGRHERHFRRRLDNPLFPRPIQEWSENDLLEVQRLDHEELIAFLQSLRRLVKQAVELKPNEETQVILDLKAELEKHYEQACSLADQQEGNKQAIRQLVEVIMSTIRRNAAGDPLAEQELAEEELARRTHFELLEHALVADLLHPDSLIEADELAAVLLTDEESQVLAAWGLFDQEQQRLLLARMREIVTARSGVDEAVGQRLALLQDG